jgi:general secretion pathway protein I
VDLRAGADGKRPERAGAMNHRSATGPLRGSRGQCAGFGVPVRFGRSILRAGAQHGFTLMEVLVSLSIFAFAAVVLGAAYLNILNSYEAVSRGVKTGEDFAFARQLVMREPDRKKLEQGGDFETASGRRARWSVEIASTNLADLFDLAFTCEIEASAGGDAERVVQRFRVLRPTWVIDPAERGKLKEDAKTRILDLQGKLKEQQAR